MPPSRRNEAAVDDYPVRPNAVVEEDRTLSTTFKSQTRTIVIFSLVYFLCGTELSVYNLLYQKLARKNGFPSWIYGLALASGHLMCVLFYPLSCRIVSKVSIRNSLSVGVFVIGSCQVLTGTLYLIPEPTPFLILSYAIQLVEGIGISLFIASTIVATGGIANKQMWKFFLSIQACLCLGLTVGYPAAQVLNEELGFFISGGVAIVSVLFTATLLKDPEQPVTYVDVPIVYWLSDKRMLIYFFIVVETFIYVGFLSVSLSVILKKFNLKDLYFSLIFSLAPFVYGISIAGWKWLIKKGFNNVMMIFIGCIIILASLILFGPAPYTSLQPSLTYVSTAMALEGIGLALKCTCVLDASEKDLRYKMKYTELQQKLIVPTLVFLGASFGYFCGLLSAGIMDNYLGYKKATLLHFILEIFTAIGVVVFALNRNYVSKRLRESVGESQPILRS